MGGAPGPRDFDPTSYSHNQQQYLRAQSDAKKLDEQARKAARKGDLKKSARLVKARNKKSLAARLFAERLGHKRRN